MIRLLPGDCREVLATLPADSVQCCVTSPPYYALRSYLHAEHPDKCREIGSEPTPEEYLATMVAVFREVRRVLRPDGTVWCNMGDSYASSATGNVGASMFINGRGNLDAAAQRPDKSHAGKPKDLLMMPARLALALQADGWWLRSDIIWHKPNPMPESCTDRPTSAHEHVFLLTKRSRYYYDADAVREERTDIEDAKAFRGGCYVNDKPGKRTILGNDYVSINGGRNCRNVWTIATAPYSEAHFATFPPALAERCIKAGSRLGDTILDPFAGAGTTLLVADRLQRDAIGIELNAAYTEMAMERCRAAAPLFAALPPAEPPEDERMADLFTGDEYQRLSPMPKPLQVPRGWDTGAGAHGTIHRTGRTLPEAAD